MKKIIVILSALLLSVSAYAQFGVVAGITSSKADLKSAYEDINNVTQYHVGVTYKMDLGLVAIQPSLLYNMKGSKFEGLLSQATNTDITSFEYQTGYLELPVQIQAGLNLAVARVYAFAEPFVGYAVSNNVKISTSDLSGSWDNLKSRLEYGVSLGAGIELIKHVQVSVKYFWNLGDMYGSDGSNNMSLQKVTTFVGENKANGVAASVAILF
ncbi:MAG: PorT family protein [Bacteroidales bacterium]|nr:PorT family protein [Bacteroidales bacterium]